jgi:hypothetical protein
MRIKRKYDADQCGANKIIPSPTREILELRKSLLWKLGQFRYDTYNTEEDEISDEETAKHIQLRKLKDQVSRANMTTDYTATSLVASEIKISKSKIPVQSAVSKSLDLVALRKKQNDIRTLIDRESDEEKVEEPERDCI